MKIGLWIFDHELDVIVDELCFSSCANYIFTAGKNKIIEKDAIVGWHGSEQQDQRLSPLVMALSMAELHAVATTKRLKEWDRTSVRRNQRGFRCNTCWRWTRKILTAVTSQRFLDKPSVSTCISWFTACYRINSTTTTTSETAIRRLDLLD